MKQYKELEIILSPFECDKRCPYCTAKTTKWPLVDMDIEALRHNILRLEREHFTFQYLTIGGNGEPSLNPLSTLKSIVNMFDGYDIPIKRLLTSGNVFRDRYKEVYNIFLEHGWRFEVTAAYTDIDKDMKVLGYDHKYYLSDRFKQSNVMLNYVILKDNISYMIDEINYWATHYQNISTISCKLLNVNTKGDGIDNQFSQWVIHNGFPKEDRMIIKDKLDKTYKFIGNRFDYLTWQHPSGKEIHFSWKNGQYGLHDLVWYGNKFVDYELNEINVFKEREK